AARAAPGGGDRARPVGARGDGAAPAGGRLVRVDADAAAPDPRRSDPAARGDGRDARGGLPVHRRRRERLADRRHLRRPVPGSLTASSAPLDELDPARPTGISPALLRVSADVRDRGIHAAAPTSPELSSSKSRSRSVPRSPADFGAESHSTLRVGPAATPLPPVKTGPPTRRQRRSTSSMRY